MLTRKRESIVAYMVILTAVSVALIITPNTSLDPINVPKLFLLIPGSFGAISLIFYYTKSALIQVNKILILILTAFLADLILILTFSKAPFVQQFFGTFGRNTGFLAYLGLALLSLSSSVIASAGFSKRILFSILSVGGISLIYSLLQTTNHDPVKWKNPYNSILGFLGNPDFESSFLGMCGIVAVSLALKSSLKILIRISLFSYAILALYLMVRSHAQQGVLVFGVGAAVVFFFWLRGNVKKFRKPLLATYSSLLTLVALIVIAGTLKMGPLADTLYKISVRQRGYYWRAAVEMMRNHPLFGVGLDSYGDWYFRYRSADAALKSATVQSNAAHNVFLDFGANGGVPLFLINLAFTALAGYCAVKLLLRFKDFKWEFSALFAAWIAYEAQALISINQLGLAVWGWILSGTLIGLEFRTRNAQVHVSQAQGNSKKTTRRRASKSTGIASDFLVPLLGLLAGLILVFPMFKNDADFRSANVKGSARDIIDVSARYPEDTQRTAQAIQLLAANNMKKDALQLTNRILKIDPENYNFWQLKAELSDPKSNDFKDSKLKMQELNPRITNP